MSATSSKAVVDALVGAEHLERPDARACRRAARHRAARTARDGSSCGGRASRESRTSAGRLAVLAEERVDQRRLADAGRAQDRGGRARPEVRPQLVEPLAGPRRDRDRRDARRDRVDRDEAAVDVVGQVGLVEDDDRGDLARPRDREVALDPAQVEVVVEPGDEQGDVDVGGHDLLVVEAACRAGCASAAIRLNTLRRGRTAAMTSPASERDPVADGREVRSAPAPRTGTTPDTPAGRSPAAVAHDRRSRDGRPRPAPAGGPRPRTARRPPPSRRPSPGSRARVDVERSSQPTRLSLPVRLA